MSGAACPCGEVHELSAPVRAAYIAVHGLKADELPALAEEYGFASAPVA